MKDFSSEVSSSWCSCLTSAGIFCLVAFHSALSSRLSPPCVKSQAAQVGVQDLLVNLRYPYINLPVIEALALYMTKIVDDIATTEVECQTDDPVIECFDLKESVRRTQKLKS